MSEDAKGNSGAARVVARTATAVGWVAAAFTAVVCVLVAATHVQLSVRDPLNNPALVRLRETYATNQADEGLKAEVRALDFLARKAYFASREQIQVGGWLAVGGAAVLLLAFGMARAATKRVPALAPREGDEVAWSAVARTRLWVAGLGAVAAVASLALALRTPTELTRGIRTPSAGVTAPAETVPAPANAADPSRSAGASNAPAVAQGTPLLSAEEGTKWVSFRGPAGTGRTDADGVPWQWDESRKENVLWKAKVPLPGLSSPVVWGGRVFVSGATRERRELYCFDAADGKRMWTGQYESRPDATKDYEVYDSLAKMMHAAPTPATDGRRVYALFANGELVAFAAGTGKFLWSRLLGSTKNNKYGLSGSLLAFQDGVIAPFDGGESLLIRFDGATGNEVWRSQRRDVTWASPILIRTAGGRDQVVTHGDPETAGWDVETGKKAWSVDLCSGDIAPSAVFAGGSVLVNFSGLGIFAVDPDRGREQWRIEQLDRGTLSDGNSMTSDGALAYHFFKDVLSVIDLKTGKTVYEQSFDESASYASPFVVKDKVYLVAGPITYVIRAGREYQRLAECKIEEATDVSPAVVTGRIYFRTEENLYCIAGTGHGR